MGRLPRIISYVLVCAGEVLAFIGCSARQLYDTSRPLTDYVYSIPDHLDSLFGEIQNRVAGGSSFSITAPIYEPPPVSQDEIERLALDTYVTCNRLPYGIAVVPCGKNKKGQPLYSIITAAENKMLSVSLHACSNKSVTGHLLEGDYRRAAEIIEQKSLGYFRVCDEAADGLRVPSGDLLQAKNYEQKLTTASASGTMEEKTRVLGKGTEHYGRLLKEIRPRLENLIVESSLKK